MFSAPGPLPLPQPPWQQKHIWEMVQEWSIKPEVGAGEDQLLVLSNQVLPAPLYLAYISLLIATDSVHTRTLVFHFVPFQPALSFSPPYAL